MSVGVIVIIQIQRSSTSQILCLTNHVSNNFSCQSCQKHITKVSEIPVTTDHFVLRFCSPSFFLNEVIKISRSNFVTIEGSPTVLHCSSLNSSGVHISEVSNLTLVDITLRNCGALFEAPFLESAKPFDYVYFASSVYIENSSNITVDAITISRSHGTGLTMLNNGGIIQINNCIFEHNSPRKGKDNVLPGGVGLHIELFYCGLKYHYHLARSTAMLEKNIENSEYTISDSTFFNNTGGTSGKKFDSSILSSSAWGRGGGMSFVVNNCSYHNKISINRCNLTHNTALWGGGLYIVIINNPTSITTKIEASVFSRNLCFDKAGGGVDVGFLFQKPHTFSTKHFIIFKSCIFLENEAFYGGGVSAYSSRSLKHSSSSVSFKDCIWTRNKATFGAALEISPHNRDSDVFDLKVLVQIADCNFTSNSLFVSLNDTQHNSGKGTVWIEGFRAIFSGDNFFTDNSGSALYAISSKIEFQSNSNIMFLNNSGFQGGALAIIGFSTVLFSDNSTFQFINNVAQDGGGAIFHLIYSKSDIYTSQACFLQNNGDNYQSTQFVFENNSGTLRGRNNSDLSHFGHSIYSTSLKSCYYSLRNYEAIQFEDMFSHIGNFTFVSRNYYDLSTSENDIVLINTSIVHSIPGKYSMLALEALDELNNKIATVYHVTVINIGTSKISVDSDYTYLSNNWIIFYGSPGDRAKISLKTITIREAVKTFELQILECPPGYIHQRNDGKGICICSAELKYFEGITSCNTTTFQSKLSGGYWVGYKQNNASSARYSRESDLMLSYCPHSHCFVNSLDDIEHTLPTTSSKEDLDNLICGNRTGILCSRCRKGYAVHYHSNHNQCRQIKTSCNLGWLLYILSELVPVTIFYIVVMVLGMKLTSGSISGFILFMQISDTLRIQSNGFIVFPKFAKAALNAYFMIASMFHLSFFQNDKLSFCLWESATNIDIFAFKYITILYALILIMVIVGIMKYCNPKIVSRIHSISQHDFSSSIIHGISGFLVICYSECTRISLFLLTPAHLYSMSTDKGLYVRHVVAFHDGELMYFKGKHLVYALPALFIFFTVGIFSPLILLSYPLCYKLFALLKISESKLIKLLCTIIPLERCKPFFDSFQSCFKDEFRFFSGLYFVYRLSILLTFTFVSDPMIFYIVLEGQLVLIALAQAVFQPYRDRWHSILDALLFANLCIINLMTMLNQSLSYHFTDKRKYVNVISTIQVMLLYAPLVYLCTYLGQKVTRKIKCRKPLNKEDRYRKFSSVSISLMNAAEDRKMNQATF